jgi:hypothetical protein
MFATPSDAAHRLEKILQGASATSQGHSVAAGSRSAASHHSTTHFAFEHVRSRPGTPFQVGASRLAQLWPSPTARAWFVLVAIAGFLCLAYAPRSMVPVPAQATKSPLAHAGPPPPNAHPKPTSAERPRRADPTKQAALGAKRPSPTAATPVTNALPDVPRLPPPPVFHGLAAAADHSDSARRTPALPDVPWLPPPPDFPGVAASADHSDSALHARLVPLLAPFSAALGADISSIRAVCATYAGIFRQTTAPSCRLPGGREYLFHRTGTAVRALTVRQGRASPVPLLDAQSLEFLRALPKPEAGIVLHHATSSEMQVELRVSSSLRRSAPEGRRSSSP